MNKFIFISILLILIVIGAAIWQYRVLITGSVMGWVQLQRLRQAGADPSHINPLTRMETFDGDALSSAWTFNLINGAGKIGHLPRFHNTEVVLESGSLTLIQHSDPDFAREDPTASPMSAQYNNAALVGFQGFQPTPTEDVLVQCGMQASPNFYGSGAVLSSRRAPSPRRAFSRAALGTGPSTCSESPCWAPNQMFLAPVGRPSNWLPTGGRSQPEPCPVWISPGCIPTCYSCAGWISTVGWGLFPWMGRKWSV